MCGIEWRYRYVGNVGVAVIKVMVRVTYGDRIG